MRRTLLVLMALGLMGAAGPGAKDIDIVVIVNRDNPVSELSLAELRHILRGDRKRWEEGKPIQFLLPRRGSAAMESVVSKVFRMGGIAELAQYYMAAIYQQRLSESPRMASEEESLRIVSGSQDTVAVVRRSAADGRKGIKIIEVEGL